MPPQAPAKPVLCQVPVYEAAPSWNPADVTSVVELSPWPQSTAIVELDPTERLIVALSAVPVCATVEPPPVVTVTLYVEPAGQVPCVHEIP